MSIYIFDLFLKSSLCCSLVTSTLHIALVLFVRGTRALFFHSSFPLSKIMLNFFIKNSLLDTSMPLQVCQQNKVTATLHTLQRFSNFIFTNLSNSLFHFPAPLPLLPTYFLHLSDPQSTPAIF